MQGSDVSRRCRCMRVPNEKACGISVAGSGSEPESAFLKPEIGRIGRERVRVLETCRRSNSKDRSRWCVAVGSGHSFRLLLLSEAAGSSFSFLLFPFFLLLSLVSSAFSEDLFSLARIHARTSPVHAARATPVCGMHMYAAFSTLRI